MGLKLMAELGLDGSGFEAGMRKAEGTVHGLAEGLKGFVIGAVGVATVEQAISRTVESASELVDTSKRLAIAPEQLQVLRQAAKESGVEMEKLASAFEKVDIAREKALMPGEEGDKARRAFNALGVSPQALRSQSSAQLFMGPLATAVKNGNPEELGIAFKEIMGKGFGPEMAVLKTDFEELTDKMKKLGALTDTETLLKLKQLGDQLGLVTQIIAAQLGPALVRLAEWIYEHVLKWGGTIASGAAGAGSLVGDAGGVQPAILDEGRYRRLKGQAELAEGLGMTTPGETRHRGIFRADAHVPDQEEKAFMDEYEKRLGRAGTAMAEAKKPWEDKEKEFQAVLQKLADAAKDLEHPKLPDFHQATLQPLAKKGALQFGISDSMTKVGNFLGGMGVSGRIEARKVQLLQQTAMNTARMVALMMTPGGRLALAIAAHNVAYPHS